MSERRVDVFFYGLFMDPDVLAGFDIAAADPRHAYVEDYVLVIAKRATLVEQNGARVYGMIYALTHSQLKKLYAAGDLQEYVPEAVLARTLSGVAIPALCYNLRTLPRQRFANDVYTAKLCETLDKLDFPSEYIATIASGQVRT